VVAVALLLDYRPRIAVALVVALALALARCSGVLERWPKSRLIGYLGRTSYSLFLVHFPVCLLVNALFSRFAQDDPWLNLAGLIVAWLASMAAAALVPPVRRSRAAGLSPPAHRAHRCQGEFLSQAAALSAK
jgi:peptidoglycan/LPS O-acetylase OafA/YrhL